MSRSSRGTEHRPDLAHLVEQRILQHTGGRVWNLAVEAGDRIVIRGSCRTYYIRQLVLSAVLSVIQTLPIELEELVVL